MQTPGSFHLNVQFAAPFYPVPLLFLFCPVIKAETMNTTLYIACIENRLLKSLFTAQRQTSGSCLQKPGGSTHRPTFCRFFIYFSFAHHPSLNIRSASLPCHPMEWRNGGAGCLNCEPQNRPQSPPSFLAPKYSMGNEMNKQYPNPSTNYAEQQKRASERTRSHTYYLSTYYSTEQTKTAGNQNRCMLTERPTTYGSIAVFWGQKRRHEIVDTRQRRRRPP